MSIIKIKQFIEVDDWDHLVETTYGRPYNFQQQDGCKERGIHKITVPSKYATDFDTDTIPEEINGEEMGVSFAAWLARDPKEWHGEPSDHYHVAMFWERNFYPDIDMVANDLHAKGLLPAGEYAINIDW